ncbi:Septum formation inhibitor MinC [Desulfofarcimen acetoxidans DSM 771]|uniref:Septum formation inhibitor MinC n=2 Tax=Desulfofarcimen acetoxidans TaxID=58138 RepID=C8W5R6_DESAS|nr:Septum formation inhibitor MinC [Desulfofarcimen acetoxidans DSM 771]
MNADDCSKILTDGISHIREMLPNGIEDLVDENTILIQRTLRSGQSIYHDGNVVLLGDVNPGAELVAGGNIIVLGTLRGVVHAGVNGDEKAIIIAFKLLPTQLRIANHITRAPDDEQVKSEQPEIARVKGGIVTIEAFQNGGERQRKGS